MSDQPGPKSLKVLADEVIEHVLLFTGQADTQVTGISHDSALTQPGDLFVCIPGQRADGHAFAPAAVAAGAVALVTERELRLGVPEIVVTDSRSCLGLIAARFLDHPAAGMSLLGVTGTNGKTTTAYLLESILRAAGHTTGLIGTIETRIGPRSRPGVRTTPDALDLHHLFHEMRGAAVDAVAMEVTSHALSLRRVHGVRFSASVFTNLTQDHLDFHGTMEDYYSAKRSLFTAAMTDGTAINADDPYGRRLLEETEVDGVSFGREGAFVTASEVEEGPKGMTFSLVIGRGGQRVRSRLVGDFNLSNILGAAAGAHVAGVERDAIIGGIEALSAVPGRFEPVDRGQPFSVIVDYAHTPDSLVNVLRTARRLAGRGRLICVFGCGGDRDRAKRPIMGSAVAGMADVVLVTSDNPRSEDPSAIIQEILPGILEVKPEGPDAVIEDRAAAIAEALARAGQGDVVVVAGKGHEDYQELSDGRIHFDDREVSRQALAALGFTGGAS